MSIITSANFRDTSKRVDYFASLGFRLFGVNAGNPAYRLTGTGPCEVLHGS
jgi:hypothetical protein